MFTVKFYNSDDDSWQSISCPRYESHATRAGHLITCYEKMAGGTGTEFRVGPGEYSACFIENAAGKTVDKYRAVPVRELGDD